MMSSKILHDGTVISWDDEAQCINVLEKASILIVENKICGIADRLDQLSPPADVEMIDVSGMIVTPGFFNGHCHMWQTAFRSMAPDIFIAQYFGWLSQMGSATRSFSARDVYLSCLEGYCEGLNAGVTSYVEHAASNWSDEVVMPSYEAAKDGGARVWWCHDLPPNNAKQLETLENISMDISAAGSLVSMGLAPDMFNWSDDAAVHQVKDIVGWVLSEMGQSGSK